MQRIRPCLAGVALLALLLSSCATRSLHNSDWLVLETPHFEVVSSLSPEETRLLARDLELYYAGLEWIVGRELRSPPQKPVVWSFDGRSIERPFDQRGESGYVVMDGTRLTVVLRTGEGFADASEEVLRQIAHFFVRQSDVRRPLWYEEGIAQVASAIDTRQGHARVAPPRMDHVQTLRDWNRASVDATLEATDLTEKTHRDRSRFIAESWALTHFACLAPQYKGDERVLARYRHALDNGAQPAQAARIAFGVKGEALGSALRAYVTGRQLRYATVVPRVNWNPGDAEVEWLSRDEGRRRLGELSLVLGRGKNALRYFRMVGTDTSAGRASALRELGRLEEARSVAAAGIELRPEDAHMWLASGRVLAAMAEEGDGSALARAREHLARAAELDPGNPDILAAQAETYLLPGEDAAEGLPLVTRAYRMVPGSLELQLLFARLEAARGVRSTAILHAKEVASRGYGRKIASEAEAFLESIRRR